MAQFLYEFLEGRNPQLTKADEGYDMNELREVYIARVESEGFRVVLPADNELQIDIDNDIHFANFLRSIESVALNIPDWQDWTIDIRPSKSGAAHRKHVTLTLPGTVEPWQRIALQAALGSDPMRELLSSIRLMRGDVHPTLFVEMGGTVLPVEDLV